MNEVGLLSPAQYELFTATISCCCFHRGGVRFHLIRNFSLVQMATAGRKRPSTTPSWLPLTTPQTFAPPMSTQQAGDASDAVAAPTNPAFSLDGREESLILPPPAANKGGSNVGDHNQQPSILPIHMDGAEK